jgi:hypothetical protein
LLADRERPLLKVTGYVDGPTLVAEVALELSDDGRSGKARELLASTWLEPLDRVQEPYRRDLDQVVERLAAVDVAECELASEREKAPDQLLAGARVPVMPVGEEKVFVWETG